MKILYSIGWNFFNEISSIIDLQKINSVKEYISYKRNYQKSIKKNKDSFIRIGPEIFHNHITIYGKCYGASMCELYIESLLLVKLNKNENYKYSLNILNISEKEDKKNSIT